MADTIADLTVTSDDWVDVYVASGITVGSQIEITNKGSVTIIQQEGSSKPDAASTDGKPISSLKGAVPFIIVSSGSDKIWLKSNNRNCLVHVEEV